MKTTLICFSLSLSGLAASHIILENPVPFKWAAYGHFNPIQPDGSDFPCKIPPGVQKLELAGAPTELVVGTENIMSFTGLAVHGGGSCQISLTPGWEPNKDSEWTVIHSIEGGCPAAHQAGNLVEPNKPDTYPYTIPEDIEPGNYTFAWTWINRITLMPEFYMNCAPVVVAPHLVKRSHARDHLGPRALETRRNFPGIFLANMGEVSNGCETSQGNELDLAIAFPHPGTSVAHPEGTDNLVHQDCDGNWRNFDGDGYLGKEEIHASSSTSNNFTSVSTSLHDLVSSTEAPTALPSGLQQGCTGSS